MAIELSKLTLQKASELLSAGDISSRDLVEATVQAVQEKDADVGAFLEVYGDEARKIAEESDKARKEGADLGPLAGIPIALKNNMLVRGKRVTAGSKILENYRAVYDGSAVKELRREGMIVVGSLNQDEFAMGSSTETSAFKKTKNPHDTSRVPGGSSGGSAASVAANMVLASLGSDTGGSVRQPAAFCGTVGLKGTYGTVSRYGLIAMASSLDQIGPFTKTVTDSELLWRAISKYDPRDATSVTEKRRAELRNKRHPGKRIGVPRKFFEAGLDKDLSENFDKTIAGMSKLGYEIVDVDMPNMHYSLPVYYVLMPAEVSTNLSRLDGVRYGLHVDGKNLLEDYKLSRGAGFGKEARRRIILGTFVLSHGYYDSYYGKACKVREMIRAEFEKVFESVDAIATPTTPTPAFKFDEKTADPVSMYLADIFTVPANIADIPGISIPCGTVSREGKDLPVGFQLMAPRFGEQTLFDMGRDVEKAAVLE